MCSNLDTDIPVALSKIKLDQLQFCKKCQGKPFIVIQRKDVFCRDCFYEYGSHKFRSTIGKSRKVKPGDRILVAFSGGAGSSALLDMIEDGLNKPSNHKKLMFSPAILYIRELNYANETDAIITQKTHKIVERLKKSCLSSMVTSIEMICQDKEKPFFVSSEDFASAEKDCLINNDEALSRFWSKINSLSTDTSKEDFLKISRQQLIQKVATAESYKYIFVGNTCTKTAIQMLTDLAQGKGSQITSEHSFSDSRFNVEILKPMREFIKKEVHFWNILRGIEPVEWSTITTFKSNKASLMKLTESYINGLEHDFPATVYTIFKTGNKLKYPDPNGIICKLCKSVIDPEQRCSASNALQLSHQLSKNLSDVFVNDGSDKILCYSCNNLVNEIRIDSTVSPQKLGIADYLLND